MSASPPVVSPEVVRYVEDAIAREVPKKDRCLGVVALAAGGLLGAAYAAWSGNLSFAGFFGSLTALGAILVAHYCPVSVRVP